MLQVIISGLDQYIILIVFVNGVLTQAGVPLPVMPTLLAAAAMASRSPLQIAEVTAAGVGGTLLGDLLPYGCGRRFGTQILGLLCRVSFSPDFCVRQTELLFGRIGPWSLLVAKFFPGLSLIAVAMAGVTRMSLPAFLLLDGAGKLLFVGTSVALGVIFHNAITRVLAVLAGLGEFGVAAVVAALALYLFVKWLQRRLFIRQLRMDRITVSELLKLIEDGRDPVILDVRPKQVRALDGTIPRAISASPSDMDRIVAKYPYDTEMIIYCACPNEESAAMAAKHLKQAGFKKIRPLLGGIDAWVEAGQPLQREALTDDKAARAQPDQPGRTDISSILISSTGGAADNAR